MLINLILETKIIKAFHYELQFNECQRKKNRSLITFQTSKGDLLLFRYPGECKLITI